MQIKKEKLLNFLGWFLIIISILNLVIKLRYETIIEFFWFCNHIPLVMGISLLFRKYKIFVGEFLLILIPSIIWNIDFFNYIFTGNVLLGDVYYYESITNIFIEIGTGVIHLSTLVFSVLIIFLLKGDFKNSWIYGGVHGIIIIPFAFLLEGKLFNLNCMVESCIPFIPNFKFYTIAFIIVYTLVIMIPLNLFVNWLNRNQNKS